MHPITTPPTVPNDKPLAKFYFNEAGRFALWTLASTATFSPFGFFNGAFYHLSISALASALPHLPGISAAVAGTVASIAVPVAVGIIIGTLGVIACCYLAHAVHQVNHGAEHVA